MAARKLQQEIDKCFKKVHEGVEEFEGIFEKYDQSTNSSQREKLVENLKRECKKLQRLRDQIKTWAASNEVKDKGPLQEKRELIETQMEKFKAVEKEMKTKAFSKEGLQASAKLDPKEREKLEVTQFLSDMVEELGRQIEAIEAESESLLAQTKKSKKDTSKADRVADLEHTTERHKWHQGKLELLLRSLENDSVDSDQVKDQEENIRYYVENNTDVDFIEDDAIYDDFNLEEEEGRFGVHHDLDKVSSQDNQSTQEDTPELDSRLPNMPSSKPKQSSVPDVSTSARRPSQHIKSPLPALATLHTMPPPTNGAPANSMKPAPPPAKPVGEPLRYASAAAAAAASDKSGVGVAPLPPPPGPSPNLNPATNTASSSAAAAAAIAKSIATSSPSTIHSQPTSVSQPTQTRPLESEASLNEKLNQHTTIGSAPSSMVEPSPMSSYLQPILTANELPSNVTRQEEHFNDSYDDLKVGNNSTAPSTTTPESRRRDTGSLSALQSNGNHQEMEDDEAILHYLPASLHDLVDSYMTVKTSASSVTDPEYNRQLEASYANRPTGTDVERPTFYKARHGPYLSPSHYPQQVLPVFDDARLYDRVDPDVLFYSFYYRQGTYQQYLAAKKLKGQSWRFHKQYQTWFQRHEEPKNITEDFEQGTYRFFDYESTWMNRRKADFKFAYKFLEDDL